MTEELCKVTFLQDNLTISVPKGTKLVDVIENNDVSLPLACRMGSCGTCRCLVMEGLKNVNEMTDAEADLFETLTSIHPNERLGCQLVVMGDVKIQS